MRLSLALAVAALVSLTACHGLTVSPERDPGTATGTADSHLPPCEEVPRGVSPLELFREDVSHVYAFYCDRCGSTMYCADEQPDANSEILMEYVSPHGKGCAHDWSRGISRAHKPPIADGTIVLVMRPDARGAFVVEDQTSDPESARYRWWYRTDGGTRLDQDTGKVKTGTGLCDVEADPSAVIEFGPFSVEWSGNTDGRGFLYYPCKPGERAQPTDTLLCVTDRTTIDGLDLADPQWRFKASPIE